MHEDDAAVSLATALMSEGVRSRGNPKEGKITIVANKDGLLRINKPGLLKVNMLGDVMCATLLDGTIVNKGQTVAGTRAIPLVVKKSIIEQAVDICRETDGIISVKEIRKPKAGIVITGNEVYNGLITDAFAPIIEKKIRARDGEIVGVHYAPDDEGIIEEKLRELLSKGADLLITTGGMSVDPDDKTRFAIKRLGAKEITYGSAVLPGAMFLVAYLENDRQLSPIMPNKVPVLGIPACGMYARITVFDIILPRILAGERIGRKELAELGHGGLCMKCDNCSFPKCPFGKG
jgi:molybdopterin biosynthesis enzyme